MLSIVNAFWFSSESIGQRAFTFVKKGQNEKTGQLQSIITRTNNIGDGSRPLLTFFSVGSLQLWDNADVPAAAL